MFARIPGFSLILALLLCAFFAPHASALTVDSLEDGPFALHATPGATDSGNQSVSAATCIAPMRHVTLSSYLRDCTADLSVGPADDEITTVFGVGGARLELLYTPGGVDITSAGNNTHFVVDMSVAVAAGRVEVTISDVAGNSILSSQTIPGPGLLMYPLGDFAGVDLQSIDRIAVVLDTSVEGDYHIRDIRVDEIASQQQAADYVLTHLLGGDESEVNLWMHSDPLGSQYTAFYPDINSEEHPPVPFPYEVNWLVMIDDDPGANWAHPVRWVFVNGDGTEHEVYDADWIPSVQDPTGQRIPMECTEYTSFGCGPTGASGVLIDPALIGYNDECLYAVLISGGWDDAGNYERYPENLTSMYQTLLGIGFPKSQIWTYYADGTQPLDMDNADGDNNHATGSDITGGVVEANIRQRIQLLCTTMNANRDVLFLYTSNHGASNGDIILWDFNSDGMWSDSEHYSPAELASDTANCRACRVFGIFDQCFAGALLPMANDGQHDNAALYAAATADEVSYGREYMDWWEDLPIGATNMNDLHASVANSGTLNSTAVMAEGAPGNGDVTLDYCWGEELFHIPSDLTMCESLEEVELQICNPLPSTQTYQYSAMGNPAAGSCNVAGPSNIQMWPPSPISIAPGSCRTIKMTIPKPAGLNLQTDTACYSVQFDNLTLGVSRTLTGRLHGIPQFLCFEIPAESHVFLEPLVPYTIDFKIQNDGATEVELPYLIQGFASDGLAENLALSINGNSPGEGLGSSVRVPGGESVIVSAQVELIDPESNIFYDVQLLVDEAAVGGKKGLGLVPVATVGVRKTLGIVVDVEDPTPRRGPVELKLFPNPFNPSLNIQFEVGQELFVGAKLAVIDARGRVVRRLEIDEALSEGSHTVRWDGRDDAGARVASGAYFVRLRTSDGDAVERAVLVK